VAAAAINRDAAKLARLLRAGDLSAVYVPDATDESEPWERRRPTARSAARRVPEPGGAGISPSATSAVPAPMRLMTGGVRVSASNPSCCAMDTATRERPSGVPPTSAICASSSCPTQAGQGGQLESPEQTPLPLPQTHRTHAPPQQSTHRRGA
jgi:hypothetical protein